MMAAIVAPSGRPPERVVSWLTEELVALGHDVTLFASGDSKTSAKLIPVWPKALRLSRRYQDPYAGYAALMEAVAQSADQFDLIHCHSDWIHLPVLKRTGVPLVTTLDGRLDLPHVREVASKFPGRIAPEKGMRMLPSSSLTVPDVQISRFRFFMEELCSRRCSDGRSGLPGRLDTRLDTPPSINRRHPDSRIARYLAAFLLYA